MTVCDRAVGKKVSVEELERMPDDGFRYDLLDGELVQMSPPGGAPGTLLGRSTSRRTG
jgi:Uma2 family endonuclease